MTKTGPGKVAAFFDSIMLFAAMAVGVALSDQIMGNANGNGSGFELQPISPAQAVGALVVAAIFLGKTEIMSGELSGKLGAGARMRRYSNALSQGVSIRSLTELATIGGCSGRCCVRPRQFFGDAGARLLAAALTYRLTASYT